MKNFNLYSRGQSLIGIIIVLVVVGLITGGLYYYLQKQIPEMPEMTEKPTGEEVIPEKKEIAPEEKIEEKPTPSKEVVPTPKPEKPTVQKCADGTPYGQCSINKPKYCEDGNFVNKCSLCDCPINQVCQTNNSCKTVTSPILLLLVENTLYDGLKEELKTYNNDVKREFGFETILKIFPSSASVFDIRSYIKQTYNNYKLNGVLLIGNLPSGEFYISPSVFPEPALGDFIYQDIDNYCEYSKEKELFEYSSSCTQSWRIRPFWISRLTPNSSSKSSLSLLKDYFRRNHAYRMDEYSYGQKSLVYMPLNLDEQNPQVRKDNKLLYEKYLSFFDMYNKTTRNLINEARENSDQLFLSEIKKPYEYEFFFYNGHGSPTAKSKSISPSDVLGSSFFLADFRSCSVGRFTTKDYLLGKYLFEGKSLFGMAFTVPRLGVLGEDPGKEMLYLLSVGEPLYKALKLKASSATLFGDPTLRMRYIKKPSNHQSADPVINLNQTHVSFSRNQPQIGLQVENSGGSPLKISIYARYETFKEEWVEGLSRTVTGAGRDENYFYYLVTPNSDSTLTFTFPFDNAPAGNYKGEISILSNDPVNPYIIIPFEAIVK